jgi:murein DD-endopeptidase MepM/ murein hydrolase activator NlpD
MPANHTGAFGAVRDNAPPPECLQGHCGVDVGYEWGEPVHAVHDGIVDWVNRGPNEDHGGVFVKITHRDGALFSWYFHLAAVPRWVQPGTKVKVGSVIGLLGDTGIKHSAPHLHFAMTVRPPSAGRERYIDPEPLLALWPLWLPDEHKVSTTVAAPGVPVRGPARSRRQPRTEAVQPASASASSIAGPGSNAPASEPRDPPIGSPVPSTTVEPSAEAATSH